MQVMVLEKFSWRTAARYTTSAWKGHVGPSIDYVTHATSKKKNKVTTHRRACHCAFAKSLVALGVTVTL